MTFIGASRKKHYLEECCHARVKILAGREGDPADLAMTSGQEPFFFLVSMD